METLRETVTFGSAGPGAIAFAMTAGLIYSPRMRKEQGLSSGRVFLVAWVLVLTAVSLAPWALSHVVDGHAPDDVFTSWAIGFPIGIVLGSFGGILWTRSALKAHFPERYGQR
ncbi:hypothetical protein GCM10011578_088720 [Streptomyces fuscichromogenes]|uniref:Uncharacterized protein n=2 Tax=Streptomyces fuscichromogenes TaxID=1324013 RepID=A0A917XMX7_9ACTN|nr:hypothetical protein GCM10011578_088720 [Streptomyces fuscichromogenes]